MFCPDCGTQLPDDARVCSQCGTNLIGGAPISSAPARAYAPNPAPMPSSGKGIADMIVDANERTIASIGSGYIANTLRGGGLSKGQSLLTDKRIYFQGKCYTNTNGHYTATHEERTVDLTDVSSSGFIYTTHLIWLILGVLAIVLGIALGISEGTAAISAIGIIAGLVFLFFYWFFRFTVYEVTFAGGSTALRLVGNTVKEAKTFDKQLRLAKQALGTK